MEAANESLGIGQHRNVLFDDGTVTTDLMSGEYSNPIRVIAFTAGRWSKDVSEDILALCGKELRPVPLSLR
ncbi:hypothetical protein [Bradyrhizobium sp. USDA 3650]